MHIFQFNEVLILDSHMHAQPGNGAVQTTRDEDEQQLLSPADKPSLNVCVCVSLCARPA